MKLTNEQALIANSTDDYIRVRALAGTGKTSTAIERIKVMDSVDPVKKVFMFTRAAQYAFEQKLNKEQLVHRPTVSTIHKESLGLVNDYLNSKGLASYKISNSAFKQAAGKAYYRVTNEIPKSRDIEDVIRMYELKLHGSNYGFLPGGRAGLEQLNEISEEYLKIKDEWGVFDYSDIILTALDLIKPVDGEIIIDEAQDLTPLQKNFLDEITGNQQMLILDPNQNIYGFAGVDPKAGLWTDRDYKEFTLTKSFRSSKAVCDFANQLLDGDKLKTDIPGGSVNWIDSPASITEQSKKILPLLQPGDAVLARYRRYIDVFIEQVDWKYSKLYGVNLESDIANSRLWSTGSVHWSKGKEYNNVFILGFNSEGFDINTSDEEKRLFYVGATRAKNNLTICFTDNGNGKPWGIQ